MARHAQRKKRAARPPAEPPPTTPKPSVVLEPDDFQRTYGDLWLGIVTSAPFQAALLTLNVQKLKDITSLTYEQIKEHGELIVSDLKGHLQLEENLLTLHTKKEFSLPFDEPEEYFSPEQVAELESTKEKFRDILRKQRYAG
jgi:hypothetical protein